MWKSGPLLHCLDLQDQDLVTLAKRKYESTKFEDNTQMMDDFDSFEFYAKRVGDMFPTKDHREHWSYTKFGFMDAVDESFVEQCRHFLVGNPENPARINKIVSVLCLTGHGLSSETATKLQNNPIPVGEVQTLNRKYLRWDLKDCSTMMGKEYTPHTVTRDASAGDVIAFQSGLLSPKWVLDQLKERDRKQFKSLVIIIVDACYSGQWATYFERNKSLLEYTKIIVQTACSGDEVSYGNLFIPLWIELQKTNLEDIQALKSPAADLGDLHEQIDDIGLKQNPSLYCDPGIPFQGPDINGVREIIRDGNTFRFFSQPDFFLRFCVDHVNKSIGAARGGTLEDIEEMKQAFTDGSIKILCFRLKIFDKDGTRQLSGTPMALILVEWSKADRSRQRLHLHLHFEAFSDPLILSCFSNITVIPKQAIVVGTIKCITLYKEDHKNDKKDYEKYSRDSNEARTITEVFTSFASRTLRITSGDLCNRTHWTNMNKAKPFHWIRSRTSIIEEFMPMSSV